MNRLVAIIAVVVSLAALHFSRPVTLPLVAGLMFAALAWPIQQRLDRHAPRWLSLLATILFVIIVFVALFAAIGWSATSVAKDLQQQSDRIAELQSRISAVTERFGVTLPTIGGGDKQASDPASETGATANGFATSIAGALFTTFGYLALAIGFAALALAERRDACDKVRARFAAGHAETMLGISAKIASAARRYFRAKTITSLLTGTITGIIALVFGIKFALVWALMSFLLEYIPTIGSLLAVVPPVFYAFIQFNGFGKPLAALAALTVAQLFLGNYADPKIEGRMLSISPLVVLLSIVFWGWLWGPAGALLGVPITVTVTIVTQHFAETKWVWALLSDPVDQHHSDS